MSEIKAITKSTDVLVDVELPKIVRGVEARPHEFPFMVSDSHDGQDGNGDNGEDSDGDDGDDKWVNFVILIFTRPH